MKAWLIRRDVASVKGHLGDVFDTKEAAEWAVYYDKGNHTIVEIEIPDPPHVWKVGDWFINRKDDNTPCRIVDMTDAMFAYSFRDAHGGPRADWSATWMLEDECEPCDPPEWWEGGR